MKRYLNSDRAREIDEKVHSAIGRRALKMKYIDGMKLHEIADALGMVYPTFTENYYKRWLPELFADFDAPE